MEQNPKITLLSPQPPSPRKYRNLQRSKKRDKPTTFKKLAEHFCGKQGYDKTSVEINLKIRTKTRGLVRTLSNIYDGAFLRK